MQLWLLVSKHKLQINGLRWPLFRSLPPSSQEPDSHVTWLCMVTVGWLIAIYFPVCG